MASATRCDHRAPPCTPAVVHGGMVVAPVAPSGLDDLFAELDAASAKLRAEDMGGGREYTGPRIPHIEDAYLSTPVWRPPIVTAAKREAAALIETGYRVKPAFCVTTRPDGEFSPPGILKPRVLDTLEASRVLEPDRNFRRPPGFKGYRGHPGGDMPQTHDDMCSDQHRNWLDGHYAQRDAHLYPAYTALQRADAVTGKLADTKWRMQTCGTAEMRAVHQEQVAKLEKTLAKAKSDPALVTRAGTPEGHFKHLHRFAGPERAGQNFQQATPWQAVTEERQIKARGSKPSGSTVELAGTRIAAAFLATMVCATPLPRLNASTSAPILNATFRPGGKGSDARPPTGIRPPTGAFGTSRAQSAARPTTGALAGAGNALLGGHRVAAVRR